MEQPARLKVKTYTFLKSVNSTNQYAHLLPSKNKPDHILCVYTDHQTQGRGQIGRNWYSGIANNLALSYLVPVNSGINKHFAINQALSLAVTDLCAYYVSPEFLSIKWPNDIYFKNKKIAGLLIQNMIRGQKLISSILGLGLNVNETHFPAELPNPASFFLINNRKENRLRMIFKLSDLLEARLLQIFDAPTRLEEDYIQKLYRMDEEAWFMDLKSSTKFQGTIRGISAEGQLLVERDHQLTGYNYREIRFLEE